MAVTQPYDGSQTCTISTEHTLQALATGHTYELKLDVNALAAGDELSIRAYDTVRSGGTERCQYEQTLAGVQAEPVYPSPPLTVMWAGSFRILQRAGTGRVIPWSIRQLD